MRVIYLHQYFNSPDMTGSTRSYEIARRLVAAGHTVDMITTWREPCGTRGWYVRNIEGVRVHWLPVPYSNRSGPVSRLLAFIRFAIHSAFRAASIEGDVVLATSTPLTIGLPGAFVAWRRRIPMVFEVRDLWPEMPIAIGALKHPFGIWLAKRLESFCYRRSRRIIALSPGMAAGVIQTGYPADKVIVVPNSADLEFFRRDASRRARIRSEFGIKDDQVLIGYTGTLGHINGVQYLVRLAAELKHNERIQFLVVGDGREFHSIETLAKELGVLNKNLILRRSVPKSQMPAILSAVDIATSLFLPIVEMEANSANKFFDGAAAGCCLAVNYGGWQAELLRSEDAGFQLSQLLDAAGRHIEELVLATGRIAEMGINARRLAEQRFSRDKLVKQIEVLLQDAINDAATL